ncbi:MAG: hypothetical protein MUO52_07860 [Desulfobacterales bacterium]|nr:hypothetical protein [Desulfobacterales bacterium]
MKAIACLKWISIVTLMAVFVGCSGNNDQKKMEQVLSKPKSFVGSDTCKFCHLEHYDSWRNTLHSRTMQDVTENRDALIVEINPEVIRADLKAIENTLKVPADEIYIPKEEEVKYTLGMQWKQMFLVEKSGSLYVAPIQYNARSEEWVTYHEEDWDKRPWDRYCGGCHAMGVDLEKKTFSEPRVGCEACHGPGSHHAALPEKAVLDKRSTIINPSHLPVAFRTQICGSCHNRGSATKMEGVEWPVGYQPGRALGLYFKSTSYAAGDIKNVYANEFARGHHQQYLDWNQSIHSREGVTCTSCHYVHQLGVAPTQFQTKGAGSGQCLECHRVINNNLAHSIHSFANCIGCHMPRIAKSAESGDTHSHVFVTLLPKDTLNDPKIPNSCQTCHEHRDADLATLQKVFDGLTKKSLLRVHQMPIGNLR